MMTRRLRYIKREGFDGRRSLFAVVLLLLALATFGCTGMSYVQSSPSGGSTVMDCNGDLPSAYPPYCRPVRN